MTEEFLDGFKQLGYLESYYKIQIPQNIFVEDMLHQHSYCVRCTSYFWDGFVCSLTWNDRKLGWKVGNGRKIILGVDPVACQNSSFLLSGDLRDYLEDYNLLTLIDVSFEDVITQMHSYWLSS